MYSQIKFGNKKSRIENGTVNIGIDFIERLAKAFDKKVEFRLV